MPLSAKDPIAKWIYDFKKSDAPQFKGKSGEDRKAMAIAAYMDAKKGAKQEKGWDSEARQVESMNEKTLHINLDAKDSPRQRQVISVLKRHEKSGAIEFDGETDKGVLFKINKPGVENTINKELRRLSGGYRLGEAVKEPTGDLKNACWKGYTAVGTKKKNGKTVPNCVPKEELKKVECPKCEGDGCSHCDDKGYHMTEKTNNLVAKHARKYNKAHVMANRKKKQKKGYVKHKGKAFQEENETVDEFLVVKKNPSFSGSSSSSSSSSRSRRGAGSTSGQSVTTTSGNGYKIKRNIKTGKTTKSRYNVGGTAAQKESMDPRDFTDKAGYVVVVTDRKGKQEIKNFSHTKPAAQRYADRVNKTNRVGGKATVHKTDGRKIMKEDVQIDEATSQKLLAKMKELAPKGQLPRNSAELRKLKARAKEELRGAAKAKKAAPKKQSTTKTSTGKKHMGSMEAGDRNIVMQLRKAQDLKGNHDIIVSPKGRTTRLPKAMIDKLLKRFDSLQKPQDKRRFQIMVTKELRKRAK